MKCALLICICICTIFLVQADLHYGARTFGNSFPPSFRNFQSHGDLMAFASEPVSAAEPSAPTRRRTRPPPSAYATRRPQGRVQRFPKEDYQYSMSWPMRVASAPSAQGPFAFPVDQLLSGAHYNPIRVLPPPQPAPRRKVKRPSKNKRPRFGDRPRGSGFRYDVFNTHAPSFQPPNFLPNFNFQPPPHMNFMNLPPHGPTQHLRYPVVQEPTNNYNLAPRHRYNPDFSQQHGPVEVDEEQGTRQEPKLEVQEEKPVEETTEEVSKVTIFKESPKEVALRQPFEEDILKEPSEDISRDVLPPVSPARQQPTFVLIDPAFDRLPNRPVETKQAVKGPHFVRVEDLRLEEPEVFPDSSSAIPGQPGTDYPNMAVIPLGKFNCRERYPGFYADTDTKCQVWHYCDVDGRMDSFLCPNGTLYNQEKFVCDWWYNVDCDQSPDFYKMNGELYKVATTSSTVDARSRPSYSNPSKVVVSSQATEGVRVIARQQDASPIFAASHQVIPATRPRKLKKRRRRPQAKSRDVVITATYSGDGNTQKDSTSHVSRRY